MKKYISKLLVFLNAKVVVKKSEMINYSLCQFCAVALAFVVAETAFIISEPLTGFICLFIAMLFFFKAGYTFWKYILDDRNSLEVYNEEEAQADKMMLAIAEIFATVSAARKIVEKKLQNGEYDNQEEKVEPAEVLDNGVTHRDLKKYVVIKRKQGEDGVSITGEFVFETNDLSEARKELAIRAKEYNEDLFTVYCLDGYVGYLDKEENGK